MNDVLHSTLCKTPSIFNLSSSTTNCSFPSTCTLKIWQDNRYGPHLPWTRIRASVERSKTASGISSMLPTHTRRLLQINTWGPSSSFVVRGLIMAKIDPASALAASRSSTSDQSVRRISPCPNNDIAPQLCNWRENISTINQPKGSDIGVESKTGQRPSSATSKSSMDRYCSLNTLWARLMVQHFTLWALEHLILVGLTRKVETLIRDKLASSSAAYLSSPLLSSIKLSSMG